MNRCQGSPFRAIPPELVYKICQEVAGSPVVPFDAEKTQKFHPPSSLWERAEITFKFGDFPSLPPYPCAVGFTVAGVLVQFHSRSFHNSILRRRTRLFSLAKDLEAAGLAQLVNVWRNNLMPTIPSLDVHIGRYVISGFIDLIARVHDIERVLTLGKSISVQIIIRRHGNLTLSMKDHLGTELLLTPLQDIVVPPINNTFYHVPTASNCMYGARFRSATITYF